MTTMTIQQQTELLPLAMVRGTPLMELPQDLYIPPDALEVFLDAFEGPLDLLLYLIRAQNIDILDIPIAEVTRQYVEYVELMKSVRLELAADYLVMAAMLAEIKSRMLLPRQQTADAQEEDPRAELVRRLQEYERIKQAAEDIDQLPQLGREVFPVLVEIPEFSKTQDPPGVSMDELLAAMRDVLQRCKLRSHHQIKLEPISIRERMSDILQSLQPGKALLFTDCFRLTEGRLGVVATFIAMLELLKQSLLVIVQSELFGPIYLRLPEASL